MYVSSSIWSFIKKSYIWLRISLALIPIGLHGDKKRNEPVSWQSGWKEGMPPFFNYVGTGDIWGEHMVVSAFGYLQI